VESCENDEKKDRAGNNDDKGFEDLGTLTTPASKHTIEKKEEKKINDED